MIEYIKQNLEPIMVGIFFAVAFMFLISSISDIIIKLALIINKK